jgi:CDP-6-deoxy-D-xylo-4-hexulose-3-dehydrase
LGQEYFGQLLEKRSPEQKLLTAALREESCDAPLWFGFPLTLREVAGISRIDLLRYLDQYRIGTRQLFAGNLLRQPYFQGCAYRLGGELLNTKVVMRQTFGSVSGLE